MTTTTKQRSEVTQERFGAEMAERFKKELDRRGLGVREFARAARVAPSIVSRLGSNERAAGVTLYSAARLCSALGVPIEWLAWGNSPEGAP